MVSSPTTGITLNIFGQGAVKSTFINNNNNNLIGSFDAKVEILEIFFLGPDFGNGITYNISFIDPNGQVIDTYDRTTNPGLNDSGNNVSVPSFLYPKGTGPSFGINGGTIEINVDRSYSSIGGYDPCWNVGFKYRLTTWQHEPE